MNTPPMPLATYNQPALLGVIVLAHGSRDPLWSGPIEAVAAALAARAGATALVRCAYLEHSAATLTQAAAELVAAGVSELRVLPLFFGLGKHARQDLPLLAQELRATYPTLAIDWLPVPTEQPRLLALLAELALEASPPAPPPRPPAPQSGVAESYP